MPASSSGVSRPPRTEGRRWMLFKEALERVFIRLVRVPWPWVAIGLASSLFSGKKPLIWATRRGEEEWSSDVILIALWRKNVSWAYLLRQVIEDTTRVKWTMANTNIS